MLQLRMKRWTLAVSLIFSTSNGWTDIAPYPIIIKGIVTNRPCQIQMVSEVVDVDLYSDSSFVSCTFNMLNHGDSITLPVGFPVMNFLNGIFRVEYNKTDTDRFEIWIDSKKLTKDDIQVPEEMKGIYDKYMEASWADEEEERRIDSTDSKFGVVRKRDWFKITKGNYSDYEKAVEAIYHWRETKPRFGSQLSSEFDRLIAEGNYPWYVWNVQFEKNQLRTIKVNYMVPSGMSKGGEYRYLQYLISTGAGWAGKIEKAEIRIKLKGVSLGQVERISPISHKIDKQKSTIIWVFSDIEPTIDNDIYVQYYNPKERSKWEHYMRKRQKQLSK